MTGKYVPGLRIRLDDRQEMTSRGTIPAGLPYADGATAQETRSGGQPGPGCSAPANRDDRAARRRSPACRSAARSPHLLRCEGQHDQASQAASELPDKVDTGNAQHAGMLSKYGIDLASITDKLGSKGKTL
jgi:hypothetical protein